METINKTASEILLQAADLLEEEGKWGKGSYFRRTDQGCSMCAHGAIAFCKNTKIEEGFTDPIRAVNYIFVGDNYYINAALKENLTIEQYLVKHYGEVGLAHYKAYKVGLTTDYNDHPDTTKQDVINKLREAAVL